MCVVAGGVLVAVPPLVLKWFAITAEPSEFGSPTGLKTGQRLAGVVERRRLPLLPGVGAELSGKSRSEWANGPTVDLL